MECDSEDSEPCLRWPMLHSYVVGLVSECPNAISFGAEFDALGHDMLSLKVADSSSCAAECCRRAECMGAMFSRVHKIGVYGTCRNGFPCCWLKKRLDLISADGVSIRSAPVQGKTELWQVRPMHERRGRLIQREECLGWRQSLDSHLPSLIDERSLPRTPIMRLLPFLRSLDNSLDNSNQSKSSCCVHVAVIGGSTPCGSVSQLYRGMNWGTPSGSDPNNNLASAWPTQLRRRLNEMSISCCPKGHRLSNLCQPGKDSAYFVETFESHIAGPLRDDPPDLVIVDVATNDGNEVINHLCEKVLRGCAKVKGSAFYAEQLLRRLLKLRPLPALMYVETAWFNMWAGRSPGDPDRFGGSDLHLPMLHHYGVPVADTMRALAGAAARAPALSHECLFNDMVHPSLEGHQAVADYVFQFLEAAKRELWSLPPPRIADADALPSFVIDFSDPHAQFRQAVHGAHGWAWMVSQRHADGHYSQEIFEPRASVGSVGHVAVGHVAVPVDSSSAKQKLGYVAHRANSHFTVGLPRAETGAVATLRVGYLRTYDPRIGNVRVSLRRAGQSSAELGTLTGRWEQHISTFSLSEIEVPSVLLSADSATGAHELEFVLLPSENLALGFTIYTIAWEPRGLSGGNNATRHRGPNNVLRTKPMPS